MNEMLKTYLADIDMITILDDISIKYGHATAWGYLKSCLLYTSDAADE